MGRDTVPDFGEILAHPHHIFSKAQYGHRERRVYICIYIYMYIYIYVCMDVTIFTHVDI